MAAGSGAASDRGGSGSSAAFRSSLDRRFQGVSNTADSIQGLSAWCIENKKYYSLIVRYWMKWLKKSEVAHRLNLFYLANDVIQNCKRKNAMVYRTSFAEVLPEAALLVRDSKVRKYVERILTIWSERNVYPQDLILELRASLANKGTPAVPVSPKASLKAKIVAEFVPQVFRQQLSAYRSSQDEAELKEKQLATPRVDICSTGTLKRLKDKAGGKRFSRDFEDGNRKLQEFVGFLEQQAKETRHLVEILNNADIFYETQYKEVKIIAKAYTSFASRVTNLKQKLDSLKATLPSFSDLPEPSEDAPSPAGSESPFQAYNGEVAAGDKGSSHSPLSAADLKLGQWDNRDVEDMDLSEGEEAEGTTIIVEEHAEELVGSAVDGLAAEGIDGSRDAPPPSAPVLTVPLSLANVDLAKISSILNSLTSVMKNAEKSSVSGPHPASPQGILGALPKTGGHSAELLGPASLQHGAALSSISTPVSEALCSSLGQISTGAQPGDLDDQGKEQEAGSSEQSSSSTLEAKIHKFLQVNPGFGLNGLTPGKDSPLSPMENAGRTPLRDEAGGTPTQDEATEEPATDRGLEACGGAATGWQSERGAKIGAPLGGTPSSQVPKQLSQRIETWVSPVSCDDGGHMRLSGCGHVSGSLSMVGKADGGEAGLFLSSSWPSEGPPSYPQQSPQPPPRNTGHTAQSPPPSSSVPPPPGPYEGRQLAYPGEATPHHAPPSGFFCNPLPLVPTLPPPPKNLLPLPPLGSAGGLPAPANRAFGIPTPSLEEKDYAGGGSSKTGGTPPPWIGRGVEIPGAQPFPPPSAPLTWSRGPSAQLPPQPLRPLHPPYRAQAVLRRPPAPPPMHPRFSGPPVYPPRRPFLPPHH